MPMDLPDFSEGGRIGPIERALMRRGVPSAAFGDPRNADSPEPFFQRAREMERIRDLGLDDPDNPFGLVPREEHRFSPEERQLMDLYARGVDPREHSSAHVGPVRPSGIFSRPEGEVRADLERALTVSNDSLEDIRERNRARIGRSRPSARELAMARIKERRGLV